MYLLEHDGRSGKLLGSDWYGFQLSVAAAVTQPHSCLHENDVPPLHLAQHPISIELSRTATTFAQCEHRCWTVETQ